MAFQRAGLFAAEAALGMISTEYEKSLRFLVSYGTKYLRIVASWLKGLANNEYRVPAVSHY